MAHDDNRKIHIDEEDVSGGSKEGVVRWILGIGLLLAIVALSLIGIIPALTHGDAEEEATVMGTMEATSNDDGIGTDGVITEQDLGDEGFSEEPAADAEVATEQE